MMKRLGVASLFVLVISSIAVPQQNISSNPLGNHSSMLQGVLFINEFMACNANTYENSDGDFEDWIEIYNSGSSSIDLAGYYLTDDITSKMYWKIPSSQPAKTTIPAKGFLLLFADEKPEKGANHLGFKLGQQGEQIILLDKDGTTIIDSITFPAQLRDVSFSRVTDGAINWVYSSQNTPGKTNLGGYASYVQTPTIENASGVFTGSISVTIKPAVAGDIIRFTVDGSDPNETSTQYSAPITIQNTTVLKARSFKSGSMPSEIKSKSYIINVNHSLPILSLITDPKNLFDSKTGIYVNDNDGRAWERFGAFDFFAGNKLGFHIPAGLRIQGNTGPKDFQKKSFRAYFRDVYGDGNLLYNLYPSTDVNRFDELVLRSGYDDNIEKPFSGGTTTGTLIRDPLITELWKRTGALASHSLFSVLYIDGSYYGIYDIKESVDENFVRSHSAFNDLDLIRARWDSTEVTYGDKVEWNKLLKFFEGTNFTDDAMVTEAAKRIDLDRFIDVQALANLLQYKSWSYGISFYREKSLNAKWDMTIWDTDRSLTELQWNGFTAPYSPLGIYFDNTITKKLLVNQNFKNKFISRLCDLSNTLFSPSNMKSIIDSLVQVISSEIPAEAKRWNCTVDLWNQNVNTVKSFIDQRPAIVRKQMQDYFKLGSEIGLNLALENGKGKIKVNTVTVGNFPWSGKYFAAIPISLTAIPDPGYIFEGWSDSSLPKSSTITLNLNASKNLSAIFKPLGNANSEIIIPRRVKSGQVLPFIVRVRDKNWNINPIDQTPMEIKFNRTHSDTTIQVKRGATSGKVKISAQNDFTIDIGNSNSSFTQKQISISNVPTISYSGTLQGAEIIWDNSSDRLITSDLTIPVGCRLVIQAGTWIYLKKNVNVSVLGKLEVEGTATDPVVITSDKWSEPWGGFTFNNTITDFKFCFIINGAGDSSKGNPTSDGWHTGHQHMFFGMNNSEFNFDNCYFLFSPGKVFGVQDSKVNVTNSVTSFVWHGGEFHRVLLKYTNSHLMNLPNDDHIYTEDIDTDGFHIDYVNSKYPQYSVIDKCYFITGKDDAIDHHGSRLKISNCWLEDFIHEGVAASGTDTVRVFNTVALKNDQGFENGWTENSSTKGPYVFIDHCVSVDNNVGLRVGDSYTNYYKNYMWVTNSIFYNNKDNVWNYLLSTKAPLPGALFLSYSMLNDSEYDNSPHCITGIPQFDEFYYLKPGSVGIGMGMNGTNLGRVDSISVKASSVVLNEIMYNAPSDMDTKDWIELYNPQNFEVDISNWILKDDDNTHQFKIPAGTIIQPNKYFVLCADTSAFKKFHPEIKSIIGNFSFGFGSNDQVRLFAASGELADSVSYTNLSPWPTDADGKGSSLELTNFVRDNTQAANWNRSRIYGGSPGIVNSDFTNIEEKEKQIPTAFVLHQNFPNPFNPSTVIRYEIPKACLVTLKVYDILGREVASLVNDYKIAGTYNSTLNILHSSLTSGVYFYRLTAGDFSATRKLVLLK